MSGSYPLAPAGPPDGRRGRVATRSTVPVAVDVLDRASATGPVAWRLRLRNTNDGLAATPVSPGAPGLTCCRRQVLLALRPCGWLVGGHGDAAAQRLRADQRQRRRRFPPSNRRLPLPKMIGWTTRVSRSSRFSASTARTSCPLPMIGHRLLQGQQFGNEITVDDHGVCPVGRTECA